MHPIFVAQDNAANIAMAQNSKRFRRGAPASSQNPQREYSSQPRDPRHEDAMTTSEPTLSSLAWLTVFTTVHDIPPAVSEQASVVDEASVLLLVLDAPPGRATASLAEEERCKVEGTRCRAGMPRHSLKDLRPMTPTMPFPSVPDQPLLWYFTGNLSRLFEVADEPATTFRVPDPNDPAGIGGALMRGRGGQGFVQFVYSRNEIDLQTVALSNKL
ncbi:hypothetical protein EDB85DRAFT_2148311 [Lactarius pseudohatsudake]|nr:hypothetical protein EDB85DRAFT_2148311 [Lactarius pseudohatsudake]